MSYFNEEIETDEVIKTIEPAKQKQSNQRKEEWKITKVLWK